MSEAKISYGAQSPDALRARLLLRFFEIFPEYLNAIVDLLNTNPFDFESMTIGRSLEIAYSADMQAQPNFDKESTAILSILQTIQAKIGFKYNDWVGGYIFWLALRIHQTSKTLGEDEVVAKPCDIEKLLKNRAKFVSTDLLSLTQDDWMGETPFTLTLMHRSWYPELEDWNIYHKKLLKYIKVSTDRAIEDYRTEEDLKFSKRRETDEIKLLDQLTHLSYFFGAGETFEALAARQDYISQDPLSRTDASNLRKSLKALAKHMNINLSR